MNIDDIAKHVTIAVSRYSPAGMFEPKAFSASVSPWLSPGVISPPRRMAKAVRVQTKPESIAGPSIATSPSLTGSVLADVLCIIEAVPTPASLTSAARRAPIMAIPARAPQPDSRLNALLKIDRTTAGTASKWVTIM